MPSLAIAPRDKAENETGEAFFLLCLLTIKWRDSESQGQANQWLPAMEEQIQHTTQSSVLRKWTEVQFLSPGIFLKSFRFPNISYFEFLDS